jgi:hypothetical protein
VADLLRADGVDRCRRGKDRRAREESGELRGPTSSSSSRTEPVQRCADLPVNCELVVRPGLFARNDSTRVTSIAVTAWGAREYGIAYLPAPLGTRSPRTHYFAPDGHARPGKTPVRTALSPRLLMRMRPEVEVLQAH